jgi:hypothetical protein
MLAAVNAVSPDVLFIGMTAPKQEKWAFEHKGFLQAQTICSIGAVFDFYAGTVKRPSAFWISLRLEWLIRLIKEPRRMWKRYLYYGPVFIAYILQKKVKYADIIETPDGPAKTEIRMMYLWKPGAPRPILVTNLARLSKGKMIGVRYNADKEWVGGTVAFFEQ